MDGLKNFDLEHWWTLMAAAGALIAIASAPTAFAAGFLCGLGLLLFGVGEFSMRHERETITPASFGIPAGKWTQRYREASVIGALMEMLGIALLTFGLYRLLTA